ncbi:MAG TPA: AlkA N-terminal domain-containing protein [Rhizomicrobium sp.]|jgi:AraC family transcriptional regulator of adaptative response / DNA-3-methyladenine glycosylase II|nr:AlkA N-terminal domain-containing protein [Rhizomicrobium sp.]
MSENGQTFVAVRTIFCPMHLTLPADDICYRALSARDARFDGRLFVGVETTGIYCRPICPARTPKHQNCRFFPSAAAAQMAGFRPCLRCRPEISPDAAAWRGTSNTVSRALALIAEGALDGGDSGLTALADRLGLGERQLRRLFDKHLGVPPIAVAQTRRILFAKQLIQETRLSMAEIADASGFGSVRRFNDAFRKLYGRAPHDLRILKRTAVEPSLVTLRLGYRPPYDWDSILTFFAARAIPGVELVERGRYRRTIAIGAAVGSFEIAPGENCLVATIRLPQLGALLSVVGRLRRMFDLDADVEAIGAHLARDAGLAPLVARRPGLRTPGAWDPFEYAVRAVLGQQITVSGARALAGKLVRLAGMPIAREVTGHEALTHGFPTPAQIAAADFTGFGMPRARIAALQALAHAAMSDPKLFAPDKTPDDAHTRLRALPGFGEWTAQYWALRALRDSDAFPAADVGLLRATMVDGKRLTPKALAERAEAWRPWRAYAAQHLWSSDVDTRSIANG